MSECSAVVLAAGKGTRMRSDLPKVLHRFRDEPLVVHAVRAAAAAGADPIVVVVGHGGDQVRAALAGAFAADSPVLRYAEQAQQLGTGHAVGCALAELAGVTGPVLILSGDVPLVLPTTLRALVAAARGASGGLAVGVFEPQDAFGYGRILRGPGGGVVGIREQRDASEAERAIPECNAGTYCVDLDRLRAILPTVGRSNAQGEIYLTDIVAPMADSGDVAAVPLPIREAAGVNSPEDLALLERLA